MFVLCHDVSLDVDVSKRVGLRWKKRYIMATPSLQSASLSICGCVVIAGEASLSPSLERQLIPWSFYCSFFEYLREASRASRGASLWHVLRRRTWLVRHDRGGSCSSLREVECPGRRIR